MSTLTAIAKKWISGLATYEPGRPIDEVARELGLDPSSIIKLASNENSLGPSPKAIEAMRRAADRMHLYPDGDNFHLARALAKKLGVPHDHLFFGHGSNEIIALLGHVYLEPGVNIVVSDYAFVVYRLVAALYQATTVSVAAKDYGHDLEAMLKAITPSTRLVFIANPNNPTGTLLDEAALDRFVAAVPPSVVVVMDEAYIDLLPPGRRPETIKHVMAGRPVILLRTFSKTYGLAGLRVGYAIAAPECVKLLHRVRQPFNVNAMAQAAALAALEDEAHVEKTREMVREGLEFLGAAFREMGLGYVPSAANFVLVKVGRGRGLFDALRRHGVIVRPVDNYGLPEFIRVTVGTRAENERLVAALRSEIRNLESEIPT